MSFGFKRNKVSVKSDGFDLFKRFVLDPSQFWVGNARQLSKSVNRIESILEFYSWGYDNLFDNFLFLSGCRIKNNIKTIYLSSFGSSGSHLIQDIIYNTVVSIPLGEVYIPKALQDELNRMSRNERCIFIECFNLVHAMNPFDLFRMGFIINTAHRPKLQGFKDSTLAFSSGLILRDPVKLVVSRTFRKQEFRDYLGWSEQSDEDYLRENINKTKKFYDQALAYPYDCYFFYEDVVERPDVFASVMAEFLGDLGLQDRLWSNAIEAVKNGASNKYRGPAVQVGEECLDIVSIELAQLRERVNGVRYST